MKGKQMAMDGMLEEIDQRELERERHEQARIIAELDRKYERMNMQQLLDRPNGSVVIIGQMLFRNGHNSWHFFRTVMTFAYSKSRGKYSVFVQAEDEQWPETPPWAQTQNHEDEPRDIDYFQHHIHWVTGEVEKPIRTWWMEKWDMVYDKQKGGNK